MSLQDRIAKRLMVAHGRVLSRTASGWWTAIKQKVDNSDKAVMDASSTKVTFGDKQALLKCEVVADDQSQTVGLQKYASLPVGYGMLFPYDPPRPRVAFHMGTVSFPIDIMFVGLDGRVTKIIENAEPGTRERWAMSNVVAVIEANAGFCADHGIQVGMDVATGLEKQAAMWGRYGDKFKLYSGDIGDESQAVFGRLDSDPDTSGCWLARLDTGVTVRVTPNWLHEGAVVPLDVFGEPILSGEADNMDKEAQEVFDAPRKDINPKMVPAVGTNPSDRFKGHDTPDNILEDQPMSPGHFDSQMGYDPTTMGEQQDLVPPIRSAAKKKPQ